MLIKKSSVRIFGLCLVQTPKCTATTLGDITSVFVLPLMSTAIWEPEQLNVCKACLDLKIDEGEWQEGTSYSYIVK